MVWLTILQLDASLDSDTNDSCRWPERSGLDHPLGAVTQLDTSLVFRDSFILYNQHYFLFRGQSPPIGSNSVFTVNLLPAHPPLTRSSRSQQVSFHRHLPLHCGAPHQRASTSKQRYQATLLLNLLPVLLPKRTPRDCHNWPAKRQDWKSKAHPDWQKYTLTYHNGI